MKTARSTAAKKLLKVPRLGEKTFEQAAGFLRINGGKEPLDASAVHPEAYPVVAKMLAQQGITAAKLIGNRERVKQIKASRLHRRTLRPADHSGHPV